MLTVVAYPCPLQADTFLPASDFPAQHLVIWMAVRSFLASGKYSLFPVLPGCESAAVPRSCSGKRSDLRNTGSAGQIRTESEGRKRQQQTGGEAVSASPSSLSVSVPHRMTPVSFPDNKAWLTFSSGRPSLPPVQPIQQFQTRSDQSTKQDCHCHLFAEQDEVSDWA